MTRKKAANAKNENRTPALMRNLLIVQMGLAGVGQREIRGVVGGSMSEINRIVKLLRKRRLNRKGA
jgi:hypothetical protein